MSDVRNWVAEYEFRFDGGQGYTPSDYERAMIEDAINGYLADGQPVVDVQPSTADQWWATVERLVRDIHQCIKRGRRTQDHGVIGNLHCILDHVAPDPTDKPNAETKMERQPARVAIAASWLGVTDEEFLAAVRHASGETCELAPASPPKMDQQRDEDGDAIISVKASWIVRRRGEGDKDWACADCAPGSDLFVPGFKCAYHRAVAALLAADGQPKGHIP